MRRISHLLGALAIASAPLGAYSQCSNSQVSIMGSGETTTYTCPGDGNADEVSFMYTNGGSAMYGYVATDDNGIIIAFPPSNTVDFEGAGVGTCRIYGFAYTGTIIGMPGDDVTLVDLASGCCILSDNYVTIVRDTPDGGMVETSNNETTVYTCQGDGVADVIDFMHTTASNSNYTYVITDENGIILGLPPGNSQDFEGAGSGTCLVWGLSYTGNITAMMGDDATMVDLSDGCFDLSDNFISVIRDTPDGGMVETTNNETTVYTCQGDGVADVIDFMHTTASNSNYTYVITDENGIILGLPPGNSQDFEGAGSGTCLVWGLSYTGNITAMMGDDATMVDLSDGCFDLSDNFISVIRDAPDGGMVETTNNETTVYTCPGDGIADVIDFMYTTGSNSNYTYVITDENGIILGLPPGNSQDFDGAGSGTCLVWGLSYTGNITAMAGDDATMVDLSDGCFDLSDNFISVIRDTPDGGMVETIDGDSVVYTIPSDGIADVIEFMHTSSSNSNYAYVVTDTLGTILGLPPGNMVDFEGAGEGVCLVWGLSYTGNVTAMMGDDATMVDLSDGCFELSSNFVRVVREELDGNIVETDDGSTDLVVDLGSGDTEVFFQTSSNAVANYTYIITDENDIVTAITVSNSYDFAGAALGFYHVYGLSYNGNLTVMLGDDVFFDDLSDGAFDLSDNFIEIEVSSSVGINDFEVQNGTLDLWPVPATDQLNIQLQDAANIDAMTIMDLQGRAVLQLTANGGGVQRIDISALPSGTYVLMAQSGNNNHVARFIHR